MTSSISNDVLMMENMKVLLIGENDKKCQLNIREKNEHDVNRAIDINSEIPFEAQIVQELPMLQLVLNVSLCCRVS